MSTHQAQQMRAAIGIARRVQSTEPLAKVVIDEQLEVMPHDPTVIYSEPDGGYFVEAWVFVSDQAVAEELSAEAVQRFTAASMSVAVA